MNVIQRDYPLIPVPLRDYFAAHVAMRCSALVERTDPMGTQILWETNKVAKRAYAVADAMLRERERTK